MENRKNKILEKQVPRIVVLSQEKELMAGMSVVFERWGLGATMINELPRFMNEIKSGNAPAIIILDIDYLGASTGVSLVVALRNKFSKDVPIWLIGSQVDPSHLTSLSLHDIQDILIKPITRAVLIHKISNFVKTPDLLDEIDSGPSVEGVDAQVILDVDLEVAEVTELGIKVYSAQWLAKGTSVVMNGPLIQEWTGSPLGKLMMVNSSEFHSATQKYVVELEFDHEDLGLQAKIRQWMLKSQAKV